MPFYYIQFVIHSLELEKLQLLQILLMYGRVDVTSISPLIAHQYIKCNRLTRGKLTMCQQRDIKYPSGPALSIY